LTRTTNRRRHARLRRRWNLDPNGLAEVYENLHVADTHVRRPDPGDVPFDRLSSAVWTNRLRLEFDPADVAHFDEVAPTLKAKFVDAARDGARLEPAAISTLLSSRLTNGGGGHDVRPVPLLHREFACEAPPVVSTAARRARYFGQDPRHAAVNSDAADSVSRVRSGVRELDVGRVQEPAR